jgi:hypothetical protein
VIAIASSGVFRRQHAADDLVLGTSAIMRVGDEQLADDRDAVHQAASSRSTVTVGAVIVPHLRYLVR